MVKIKVIMKEGVEITCLFSDLEEYRTEVWVVYEGLWRKCVDLPASSLIEYITTSTFKQIMLELFDREV